MHLLNKECYAKIKFIEDTWIEVCYGLDENEEPMYEEELIKEDDILEVDVLAASGVDMNEDNLNDMRIDDIYDLIDWNIVSTDLYIRFVEGNYESDDKEKLIEILLTQLKFRGE